MLKLRNPGWPPEGASGSPVSVLMPGHIAPEDDRRAMEAEDERGSGGGEWITEGEGKSQETRSFSLRCGRLSRGQKEKSILTTPKHSEASKAE